MKEKHISEDRKPKFQFFICDLFSTIGTVFIKNILFRRVVDGSVEVLCEFNNLMWTTDYYKVNHTCGEALILPENVPVTITAFSPKSGRHSRSITVVYSGSTALISNFATLSFSLLIVFLFFVYVN